MPTFIIRKRIRAKTIYDAANNEHLAKVIDVLTEEEEDDEETEIYGFECKTEKCKPKTKKK